MHRIEKVLRQEIGLDAASVGSPSIERTVRLRMKNLGLKSVGDYLRLLESSRAELDELIEAVVVLETWFFRDRDPFSAFVELALAWLEQHPADALRVLSVPCSTGEEAYSLAIALVDAQAPRHRFVINAVDVSANALARARLGIYGKNSFRGSARGIVMPRIGYGGVELIPPAKEFAFRDRYFDHRQEGYVLNPRVRECVQLCCDNLLGDRFLLGHTPYDFIFCRNLLIYFDRDTQVRALEKLHLLLAPQGVLFVGAAELPLVTDNGFVNARLTKAFACRKAAPILGSTSGHAAMPLPETREDLLPGMKQDNAAAPPLTWAPATREKWPKAQRQPCRENAIRITREMPSDLDTARQLADAGDLEKAATVCQAHLHERGPSAPAYYLLGLVREAVGDPQAIEYYRKALYLEPNHYETLLQMSLLLEKTGDPSGARILKRRAQRVQQTI